MHWIDVPDLFGIVDDIVGLSTQARSLVKMKCTSPPRQAYERIDNCNGIEGLREPTVE